VVKARSARSQALVRLREAESKADRVLHECARALSCTSAVTVRVRRTSLPSTTLLIRRATPWVRQIRVLVFVRLYS